MEFLSDDRAQAIQIGAVLLFGILILFLSLYQAFVVPNQNEEVEFNHNEELQQQMTELRSNVILMPGSSSTRAASVDLGTRYPSRALFVNPGPASGTLRTVGTGDPQVNVTIRNASAVADEGETGDFWNGSARSYNTGALEYRPGYNLYANAPRTVYEHSVLYNHFEGNGARLPITGQALIDGNRITLIALNGSLLDSRVDTLSVDFRPVSTRTRTVTLANRSGDGPITLALPTDLDAAEWEGLLDGQDRVADVRDAGQGRVEIELAAGEYQVELAKVGVGTRVTETEPAYMTDSSGGGRTIQTNETTTLEVEVRDPFNKPVRGVTVNASAERGEFTASGTSQVTKQTDNEGRITVEYEGINPGSNEINFSFAPGYEPAAGAAHDAGTPENVTMAVEVESPPPTGGGGQVAYNTTWLDPSGEPGTESCDDSSCTLNYSVAQELDLTAATDPTAEDARVEFAVGNRSVGAVTPAQRSTDSDGEATTTFKPSANGTVNVYAWSGGSGDAIEIEVINFDTPTSSALSNLDIAGQGTDATITEGDDEDVSVTVENTGAEDASFVVDLDIGSGQVTASETTNTLAPGETETVTFTSVTGGLDPGDYDVVVSTDDDQVSGTLTVEQPPTSALSNLDIAGQGTDATITEGDDEDVSVVVENVGDQDGSFDVTLTITNSSGTQVQQTRTTSVAAGATETVTFTSVTGGLDPDDYTVEVSTDDDQVSGTLTVEQPPTSVLSNLNIAGQGSDATITEGDDEDVSVVVENVGDQAGSFDVTLEIEDSGGTVQVTETQTTGTLSAGGAETVTFTSVTGGLDPGDYDVVVSTDDDQVSGTLTVEQPATSVLSNLDIAGQGTDATISEGDDEDISVDVENVGDQDGSFDVTLTITNSSGTQVQQTRTTSVAAGATETVTFTSVTGGLDPDDYTVEVSTDDDLVSGVLTVNAPQASLVDRVDGSATSPGNSGKLQFDFTTSGEVNLTAAAIETTGNLDGVGAQAGSTFSVTGDVNSSVSTGAADTDGNFAYEFVDGLTLTSADGNIETEFDSLEDGVQNFGFVDSEGAADIIISLRFSDGSVKEFYFEGEEF